MSASSSSSTATVAISAEVAAATVRRLDDPRRRRLVRLLQWHSQKTHGLARLAEQVVATHPGRLGSHTMHAAGFAPDLEYTGDKYEQICSELGHYPCGRLDVLLSRARRLELVPRDPVPGEFDLGPPSEYEIYAARRHWELAQGHLADLRQLLRPDRRVASVQMFIGVCRDMAQGLPAKLARMCQDPDETWDVPYFSDLVGAVENWALLYGLSQQASSANTPARRLIHKELDDAWVRRELLVLYGDAGAGKKTALRCWQEMHADKARVVAPDPADPKAFQQLVRQAQGHVPQKGREDQSFNGDGEMMIIVEDAHLLFGNSSRAPSAQFDFIRRELVDRGTPVALVGNRYLLERLESEPPYSSVGDFRARIDRCEEVPSPDEATVTQVVLHHYPECEPEVVRKLVAIAQFDLCPLKAVARLADDIGRYVAQSGSFPAEKDLESVISRAGRTSRNLLTAGKKTRAPTLSPGNPRPRATAETPYSATSATNFSTEPSPGTKAALPETHSGSVETSGQEHKRPTGDRNAMPVPAGEAA